MDNKTFIPTIENLRFKGNVDDIENWFDNITGNEGSYRELTLLLDTILEKKKISDNLKDNIEIEKTAVINGNKLLIIFNNYNEKVVALDVKVNFYDDNEDLFFFIDNPSFIMSIILILKCKNAKFKIIDLSKYLIMMFIFLLIGIILCFIK